MYVLKIDQYSRRVIPDLGVIGEKIAKEILRKNGFEVLQVDPYLLLQDCNTYRQEAELVLGGHRTYYNRQTVESRQHYLEQIRDTELSLGKDNIARFRDYFFDLGYLARAEWGYDRWLFGLVRSYILNNYDDYEKLAKKPTLCLIKGKTKRDLKELLDKDYWDSRTEPPVPYHPDIIARKDNKIFIFEVKVNQSPRKYKKLVEASLIAKKYGCIPLLLSLKVEFKASNVAILDL